MIVKNEDRYLEQCLRSAAAVVDEICIVDTGSTDRTIEIAQRFGAKIERREWRDDFAWARNEAIAMATKRWILMLDADEELTPDSLPEIEALKGTPAATTGLYIRCNNLSDDYKGTGSLSHLLVRIFPNHPKIRFISPVHEYVTYDNREMGMDALLSSVQIVHHGYLKDVVAERDKANRNFALIRRATELHPEDAFHWYNLGMTAHVVKDYDQAIEAFEKMRSILNGAPRAFLPQSLVTLAECYSDGRNDDESALSIVDQALVAAPRLTNAHFTRGRLLHKMGRREEARAAFIESIDCGNDRHKQFIVDDQVYTWKAQLSLGVTYADERRFEEALEWYDKGLANQPGVQPLLVNRAHALEGLERYADAEAAFRALYERYPDETSIVQLVNFFFRRKDYQNANATMEQTLEKVSPRTAATFYIANAQLAQRTGNRDAELANLKRAHEVCPAAGPVADALEAFYRATGNLAAIEELHRTELQFDPEEPPDFVRRSYRMIAMDRFGEALDAARQGLKLAPTHAELRYNSAVARIKLGDPKGALEDLAISDAQASEVGKKTALLRAGLLRDARRHEEAVVALDAAFADAPNVDAGLLRAQCLEALGRHDEAAASLETVFDQDRQRVGVELASLYMRAGRFAEAQQAAERALAPA